MGRRVLDPAIMSKLANKLGKPVSSVNVMVSKLAHRHGISPEAALIILGKRHKIGTAIYHRNLDSSKQAEVRESLPSIFVSGDQKEKRVRSQRGNAGRITISNKLSLRLAIEYLIQDAVLLSRCRDILMASSNFDRPINQATQILEDRIRTKAQPSKRLTGENLVGFAFNEDITKTVLRVVQKRYLE